MLTFSCWVLWLLVIVDPNCIIVFTFFTDKQSILNIDLTVFDKSLEDKLMSDSLSVIRHPALLPFTLEYMKRRFGNQSIDLGEMKVW